MIVKVQECSEVNGLKKEQIRPKLRYVYTYIDTFVSRRFWDLKPDVFSPSGLAVGIT